MTIFLDFPAALDPADIHAVVDHFVPCHSDVTGNSNKASPEDASDKGYGLIECVRAEQVSGDSADDDSCGGPGDDVIHLGTVMIQ